MVDGGWWMVDGGWWMVDGGDGGDDGGSIGSAVASDCKRDNQEATHRGHNKKNPTLDEFRRVSTCFDVFWAARRQEEMVKKWTRSSPRHCSYVGVYIHLHHPPGVDRRRVVVVVLDHVHPERSKVCAGLGGGQETLLVDELRKTAAL